jgi:hypothetical protein
VTLFSGASLLISLPGSEVRQIQLSGSIVDPHEILAAAVSQELRSAVHLVCDEAARRGVEAQCMARPELFTHGVSESWLRGRIDPSVQHLCLSDGTAVKPLPSIPTHVFFYNLAPYGNVLALQRLSQRAPELMTGLRSQINSCFVFGSGAHRAQPVPLYLNRATSMAHPESRLLPFFFNRDSAEDSINRIEQQGAINPENLADYSELRYVPLTETALKDRGFAKAVAELVLLASFDPSALLVLRLPTVPEGKRSLVSAFATMLPPLRDSGVMLPRVCPQNIVLSPDDLDESHPILARFPLHVFLHESFDFWRYTSSFYARAARITVLSGWEARSRLGFLPDDVSPIYGPKAARRSVDTAMSDQPTVELSDNELFIKTPEDYS